MAGTASEFAGSRSSARSGYAGGRGPIEPMKAVSRFPTGVIRTRDVPRPDPLVNRPPLPALPRRPFVISNVRAGGRLA